MATATKTIDTSNFGHKQVEQTSLSQNGVKRSEWWLNVDYAETVEIHNAVSTLQQYGH